MIYTLNELLTKLGAPEVKEKKHIEWYYFDTEKNTDEKSYMAGHAEIRLERGDEIIIAELKRIRENYIDDDGVYHETFEQNFYFAAERTARPDHYRVLSLTLDGQTYDKPKKAIIELALSVFHAQALDISILMVEQAFNKQDILDQLITAKTSLVEKKKKDALRKGHVKPEAEFGVVIQFPTAKMRAQAS